MLLKLDFQSDIPIYLQLKAEIIEGITTGQLKPGEALPSVRQLAADLGINMHTVNKTYNYLKQDGFILIHRQKGVVINNDGGPRVTNDYLNKLQQELRPIIAEASCRRLTLEEFTIIITKIYDQLQK